MAKLNKIILLTLILLLLFSSVSYAAWLTDWSYRKEITITGSSAGAQTDYQMRQTIYYGAGTDSATAVYLNSLSQTDFDDIRFTTSDGTTLLDYWIESKTDSDNEVVWVEFDSIPASPSTATFYLYYGNAGAAAVSSGDNTFLFFDDFPGSSLDGDKWTIENSPTVSVSGGILTLSGNTVNAWRAIHSNNTYGPYLRWRSRIKANSIPGQGLQGLQSIITGWTGDMAAMAQNYFRTANDATYTTTNYAFDYANYHIYDILWKSGEVKIYEDASLKATHTTNIPNQALYCYAIVYGYSPADTLYEDWVTIANYVSPEPTWTSWGFLECSCGYATCPVTVGTGSGVSHFKFNGAPYTNNGFYGQNKYWQFFSNGTYLKFATSSDVGLTWSGTTTVTTTYAINEVDYFSIVFDGTYCHYVTTNHQWSNSIYYRRGLPNADGTITWDTERTVATCDASCRTNDPDIIVDSNGYPWISYGYESYSAPTYSTTVYVRKSSTKDGTWTNEFTQAINATAFTSTYTPSGWGTLVALTSGKVYAFAGAETLSSRHYRGRLYTTSWQAEEDVSSFDGYGAWMTAIPDGDNIHFTAYNMANSNQYYIKYTYGTGWGTPILGPSPGCPVTISFDGISVYCFWLNQSEGHQYIKYSILTGSTWSAYSILSEDCLIFESLDAITAYAVPHGNRILIWYPANTSDPRNLRIVGYPYSVSSTMIPQVIIY